MSARGGAAPRGAVVAVASALLLATVGAVGAAVAGAQEHEHDLLPEGDWSEEQIAAAEDLVMRTEEALPTFGDPEQLEGQGFVNFGAAAPGGYDHWTSAEYLQDDHLLDPTRPESLVFQSTADGYELVAAMFEMRPGDTMDDIPEDIAWYPGWHNHPDLCADENNRFTGFVNPDGTCTVGQPILVPMMHVWIVDNECGHRFAGVDQGGLICDVHGHPGGGGPGTTHPPGHGTTPTTHPPGHGPTTSTTMSSSNGGVRPSPPATPVQAEPNLTG